MARLKDSLETREAIKKKALLNAIRLGTYRTRSVFRPGRRVLSFDELCSQVSRRAIH